MLENCLVVWKKLHTSTLKLGPESVRSYYAALLWYKNLKIIYFFFFNELINLAVSGLCCGTGDLHCVMWARGLSSCAHKLSCPMAGGILVGPGIKAIPPALQGKFLITGSPEKSLMIYFCLTPPCLYCLVIHFIYTCFMKHKMQCCSFCLKS